MNLRELVPEGRQLTWSKQVCDEWGVRYPCSLPRGRSDGGDYPSIETSDSFEGMRPGYFIVMASSGAASDVDAARRAMGRRGVRGYVRTAPIYVGCVH